MAQATATRRVEKLNNASLARIIDPDKDLPGALGDGAVLPDDLLLPTAGLDEGVLTAEQYVTFSRQSLAAITRSGLMFEAILMAGFGLQIARTDDFTDPRITYLLHELGEETRHSRLFARLLDQLGPAGAQPHRQLAHHPGLGPGHQPGHPEPGAALHDGAGRRGDPRPAAEAGRRAPRHRPLRARGQPLPPPGGGAAPRLRPHPPARGVGAAPASSTRRSCGSSPPTFIREMYENMIHAGVFGSVGLPAMSTWQQARNHPGRVQTRVDATRPVLEVLLDAGALERGKVPTAWRGLCAVDPDGHPVDLT